MTVAQHFNHINVKSAGTVEEITRNITVNPASMHNAQPWLGIANITKEDLVKDRNVIKGANIQLIGVLHSLCSMQEDITENQGLTSSQAVIKN